MNDSLQASGPVCLVCSCLIGLKVLLCRTLTAPPAPPDALASSYVARRCTRRSCTLTEGVLHRCRNQHHIWHVLFTGIRRPTPYIGEICPISNNTEPKKQQKCLKCFTHLLLSRRSGFTSPSSFQDASIPHRSHLSV